MVELVYPEDGAIINIETPIQKEFIKRIKEEKIAEALVWLKSKKDGNDMSSPERAVFRWSGDGRVEYLFEIAETPEFSDAYSIKTSDPCCDLYNLKTGTRYYWRVNGSDYREIYTEACDFRFIRLGGLINVRDVGGINIKEGLVYRGCEINHEYRLTEEGKAIFKDQLGIKTEINLRKETSEISDGKCIVDGVGYIYLPYRPYAEVFSEEHRCGLKNIMDVFADEENYPIYFHCYGGADRTGMIALYLRALCGESDEDIFIDYELTSLSSYTKGEKEGVTGFGFRSHEAEYFDNFLKLYSEYDGKNLAERTESFILSCGVEKETIDRIRRILKK